MKRLILLIFLALCLLGGCVGGNHAGTGVGNIAASSVSDEEMIALSRKMRIMGDAEASVASGKNKYALRLARLTDRFVKEDGLELNFAAYISPEANVSATADGSVRICSGLMDMMTDNELCFVIGHIIGHVKAGNCLDNVRAAYVASGFAEPGTANIPVQMALSNVQLGELFKTILNAEFSPEQERDADIYGYLMMQKYTLDRKAAVSALKKLEALGADRGMPVRHLSSGERAVSMQKLIDRDEK